MDMRIKELIAVGASITANCKPCLKYHLDKARKNGAQEQEIIDAIKVGTMVRKGAASQMNEHISTLFPDACAGENALGSTCG